MSMIIKRRQLVMATMVVALGAAVFVNWYFTKPHIDQTGIQSGRSVTQDQDTNKVNLGDAEFVNSTTTKPSSGSKKSST
ncbi:MAG: hypothetical protein LBH71_02660, partial [Oscillospiraceae bacterium]|nr:hypothetical protein [Oscillospiraceae bacterium]